MAQEKNLLQEAIAEAHMLRDAAVQNAYKELEESLTPSIKAMLEQKLEEEINLTEEEEEESLEENATSGFKEVNVKQTKTTSLNEEDEEEQIEDGGEEPEEEAEPDGDEDGDEAESDHPEPDGDESEDGEATELSDDTELSDITLGDLKDVIADLIAQANGTEDAIAPEGDEGVDMEPADVEGTGEEDAPLENSDEPEAPEEGEEKKEDDEEIDLSEILKELEEEQKAEKSRKVVSDTQDSEEVSKLRKENKEYKSIVKDLKDTLSEVNLLNAKLMYTTRLFSKRTLSESQKVRVIRSFDIAQNPGEVKVVYDTLTESFDSESKKNNPVLKEHRGTASRSAGVSTASKSNIIDVDPFVKRMQQLAGIIQ